MPPPADGGSSLPRAWNVEENGGHLYSAFSALGLPDSHPACPRRPDSSGHTADLLTRSLGNLWWLPIAFRFKVKHFIQAPEGFHCQETAAIQASALNGHQPAFTLTLECLWPPGHLVWYARNPEIYFECCLKSLQRLQTRKLLPAVLRSQTLEPFFKAKPASLRVARALSCPSKYRDDEIVQRTAAPYWPSWEAQAGFVIANCRLSKQSPGERNSRTPDDKLCKPLSLSGSTPRVGGEGVFSPVFRAAGSPL